MDGWMEYFVLADTPSTFKNIERLDAQEAAPVSLEAVEAGTD
jgi:hypothetical protein